MERYTYMDGGKWRVRIGDAEYSGPWIDRLAAYEDTGLEPEEVTELRKSAELERKLGSVAGKHLDSIIQTSEKIIAQIEDREELQAYRALGTVEELAALVKARAEAEAALQEGGTHEADPV